MERNKWLQDVSKEIALIVEATGFKVPKFRIGFAPLKGKTMGVCYRKEQSLDEVNDIFIDSDERDPVDIMATICHELIHATSNCEEKHGAFFKEKATAYRRRIPPGTGKIRTEL